MKNHNACRRQWADEPSPQPVLYFTWLFALSLGSFYLDPQKQDSFTLVVTVKDMAGMTMNAFTSSADVIITVKESLWKAPPTIRIQENSTQVHPVNVSQVGPLPSRTFCWCHSIIFSWGKVSPLHSISGASEGLWHLPVIFLYSNCWKWSLRQLSLTYC